MSSTVIPFDPAFVSQFRDLNLQWIQKFFVVEPMDLYQLEHPETTIIKEGGEIFFVKETNGADIRVVGTCALIPHGGEGSYELIKMAVDPASQGKGYGKKLMERAVQWCKEKKAKEILILSNTVLGPAIEMYKKSGFEVVHLGSHPDYERCNILLKMNLILFHVGMEPCNPFSWVLAYDPIHPHSTCYLVHHSILSMEEIITLFPNIV